MTILIQSIVLQIWHVENSIEIDKLIDKIRSDERRRTYWLEPLGFNIFQNDGSDVEDSTSTEINGQFLHSQLLLESLLTMNSDIIERTSSISYFRREYIDNARVLEKIDEFESTYVADRALFWYTQDSFFYRVLNKAFRIQNIDALYLMRVFIRDIQHQLVEQQRSVPSSVTQVYRGQLISKLELEHFKIGELISMNSFFSTTLERAHATFLLPDESPEGELTSVIFEININEYLSSTKPFANITTKSAFPDESEVLFMAGSIFRITDTDLKIDSISVIKLCLCNDDDHNLRKLFEYMREDIPLECHSLTYGIVLANASKVEQAEKFFRNVLNELPADDPLITHVYHQLGNVLDDRGEYQESLDFYEKALAKKLEILPGDSPSIANTYTCCGVAYLRKNQLNRALEFYQKALNIYKKECGDDDDQNVAMCLYNIGDVKMFEKNFEESISMYEQALNIWIKCLPENHPDIARAHMAIAHVQVELLLGNQALKHYIEALNIMKNSLPPIHHELAALYDHIGTLYYSTGDNETAQDYFQASLEIKQKLYSSDHQAMADSYHSLGLIYKEYGDYQKAITLLEQALVIQNKFFPPDHEASIRLRNDLEEAKTSLV